MEADYTDTYTATIRNVHRMTARDLFQLMFVYYPKPILYMLKLRDWLVKPIGLQEGGGFTELIREEDEKKSLLENPTSIWSFRSYCSATHPMLKQHTNPFR